MTASLYNPSTHAFVDLSVADRAIFDEIGAKCSEIIEPTALEKFDSWLDRMAKAGYISVIPPGERNARVLGAANRSGKVVVQRTVDPVAPPTEPAARTVQEYLAKTGETREQAVNRVLHRFGPPGRARTIDETPRTLPGTVVAK